ncbi:MAG: AGE family epimerase/isomerase [Syntrophales bacterium LBB04]|nr:AGE family epimerase/isomerase [Syntrophales bacterium LBB04]
MFRNKILRFIGSAVLTIILLVGIFALVNHMNTPRKPDTNTTQMTTKLSSTILDNSIKLGTSFILANQKKEGNFNYEYDFVKKTQNPEDSQVRQAGALWGLALLYQDKPSEELLAGIEKGLEFFSKNSKENSNGKYILYPEANSGDTGTVALVTLTLADFLSSAKDLPTDIRQKYEKDLNSYLNFLISLRKSNGQFFGSYELKTGKGTGLPSPYFDGESLLALIKTEKYLNRADLKDLILASADSMFKENIEKALKENPDSDTTKGFYQWGTMAFYEIYTSEWADTSIKKDLAKKIIDLAYWMIDTHKVLERTRNTAYAYEGLASAWEIARLSGDKKALTYIGKAIDKGLYELSTWQVGSSIQNKFLKENPTKDPLAIGGIMNAADEAPLRIDVTQHQMHAALLARNFIYKINSVDMPTDKNLSPKNILNSINLAGNYLINSAKSDGEFDYLYDAKTDKIQDEYNILRHAGTIFSMMEFYSLTKNENALSSSQKALSYLEKQIKPCKTSNNDTECVVETNEVKLGGNGLAIVAMAEYTEATGDQKYVETMRKLARWIIDNQKKSGEFAVHKQTYSDQKISTFISDYYPGEAILGLMKLYKITNDKIYLDSAVSAATWRITVRDKNVSMETLNNDHWLLYGLNELYRFDQNKIYIDHVFKICDAIFANQQLNPKNPEWLGGYYNPPRSTPTATRSEGLIAAYNLAKDYGHKDEAEKILKALELGLGFQLKTQIDETRAAEFKNPKKALGGFTEDLDGTEIRIDYVQHNLSSLIGFYKILISAK